MIHIKKIICITLCSFFLFACGTQTKELPKANMNGYENLKTENHQFKKYSMKELLNDIKDKKDGIYYMGYIDCPWCQDAVPVLDEAAKEEKVSIHYIAIRDKDKKRTYSEKLENQFIKFASKNLMEDDKGEKKIYVPYVFVLKDGEIIQDYIGTLETYDVTEREMNKDEELLLKTLYQTMMRLF